MNFTFNDIEQTNLYNHLYEEVCKRYYVPPEQIRLKEKISEICYMGVLNNLSKKFDYDFFFAFRGRHIEKLIEENNKKISNEKLQLNRQRKKNVLDFISYIFPELAVIFGATVLISSVLRLLLKYETKNFLDVIIILILLLSYHIHRFNKGAR